MADPDKPTSPPGDYDVGYGKPPTATRFKKGQSGNPKGRPKGSVNIALALDKALREKVTITENGRRKQITKAQAAAKQIVNKAASGDLKAFNAVKTLAAQVDGPAAAPIAAFAMKEADHQVLQHLQERFEESVRLQVAAQLAADKPESGE